jgi:hypothetical protein
MSNTSQAKCESQFHPLVIAIVTCKLRLHKFIVTTLLKISVRSFPPLPLSHAYFQQQHKLSQNSQFFLTQTIGIFPSLHLKESHATETNIWISENPTPTTSQESSHDTKCQQHHFHHFPNQWEDMQSSLVTNHLCC